MTMKFSDELLFNMLNDTNMMSMLNDTNMMSMLNETNLMIGFNESSSSLEDFEVFDLRDAMNVLAYFVMSAGDKTGDM